MTLSPSPALRRFGAPCALFLLTLLSAPQGGAAQETEAPAFDLTGEWILETMSPNGAGTRDVTFVQEGTTLTGEIASSMAAGTLEGTIEGNVVTFTALVYMDSGSFEISYQASYEDGKLIDGTIDFGSYGGGTFTGHRKEEGGGR